MVRGALSASASSGSARISSSRSSSISSASMSPSANSAIVLHLLVAQRFETRTQRVERGSDGLRRRRQQLAQDERGQVALALGERVAVFALQEPGHRLVERVLVVARRERPRDRPPLGVADVLGDLVAQRALAEARQALPQIGDAAAGAGILGSEGVEIPEQVLVDEGREAVQLEQRVLQRRGRQQQLAAILGRPADALADLVARPVGVAQLVGFVDDDQIPGDRLQLLAQMRSRS